MLHTLPGCSREDENIELVYENSKNMQPEADKTAKEEMLEVAPEAQERLEAQEE